MSLVASLRRVMSWRMHAAAYWLDPEDSYHQPVRMPGVDDEKWVVEIIRNSQPIPWSQLIKWSALPIPQLRDICTDLHEAGVIAPTIKGFIIVGAPRERVGS